MTRAGDRSPVSLRGRIGRALCDAALIVAILAASVAYVAMARVLMRAMQV